MYRLVIAIVLIASTAAAQNPDGGYDRRLLFNLSEPRPAAVRIVPVKCGDQIRVTTDSGIGLVGRLQLLTRDTIGIKGYGSQLSFTARDRVKDLAKGKRRTRYGMGMGALGALLVLMVWQPKGEYDNVGPEELALSCGIVAGSALFGGVIYSTSYKYDPINPLSLELSSDCDRWADPGR